MERLEADELLDQPGHALADVAASLRDVQAVNRYLAGTAVTRGHLFRLLRRRPATAPQPATFLDLCAGSADIPRALLDRARRRSLPLAGVAYDINPVVLQVARQTSIGYPDLRFVRGDARRLPFCAASFDYVICSMALHHFDADDATSILREMNRVSRYGLVVNDLRRSRVAYALIRLLTTLLRAHPLTRHDGPLSTLRAWTPRELRNLADRAGLTDFRVRRHLFYRMALIAATNGGPH